MAGRREGVREGGRGETVLSAILYGEAIHCYVGSKAIVFFCQG